MRHGDDEDVTLPEAVRRIVNIEKSYVTKETFRSLEKIVYLFAGATLTGLFALVIQVATGRSG